MKNARKGLGVLVGRALLAILSLVGLGSGPVAWMSQPVVAEAVPANAAGEPQTTLLVRFGVADREPTEWDGKITVSAGKVERLEPWRFANEDKIDGESWTISTRRMRPQSAAESDHPCRAGM